MCRKKVKNAEEGRMVPSTLTSPSITTGQGRVGTPACRLFLDGASRNLYLSRQAELARQNFVFFPVCVEAETARERRLCGVFPLCSEVDLR